MIDSDAPKVEDQRETRAYAGDASAISSDRCGFDERERFSIGIEFASFQNRKQPLDEAVGILEALIIPRPPALSVMLMKIINV